MARPMICAVLALLLSGGALAAEPDIWFRFDVDPVWVHPDTAKDHVDWLGEPDWGLRIETSDGRQSIFAAEAHVTSYYATSPGAQARAQILELDPGGCCQIVTVTVPLPLDTGFHTLSFPDGSRVRVAVEPFAPEGTSGPDATPEGARPLMLGTLVQGQVWFEGGDRTDHWRLDLTAGDHVELFVVGRREDLKVSWVGESPPRGATGARPFRQLGAPDWAGRLGAGSHVLCVEASPQGRQEPEEIRYQVAIVPGGPAGEGPAALAGLLLQQTEGTPDRLAAIHQLTHALQHPAAQDVILEALSRSDPEEVWLACILAGELELGEARPRLEQLATDAALPSDVRQAATHALAALTPVTGDEEAPENEGAPDDSPEDR